MAGQQYGLPSYVQSNTHGLDPHRSQAHYHQQGYDLDFSSSVKYEPIPSKEDNTRWRNLRYESPTKRQKVEDTVSEVKFVSQTKWKFPESQKWIAVQQTPSTQTRNAARASREAENTALLQARQKGSHNSTHTRNVSDTQLPNLGNAEELKDARSTSESTKSRLTGHDNTSKSVSNQSTKAQATPMNANTPSNQRQTKHDINASTFSGYPGLSPQQTCPVPNTSNLINGIEIGPTHVVLKAMSQTDRALSLEKDADRIAALIAEKRKTNEATMFRQKMLQKQMEHHSERTCTNQAILMTNDGSVEPADTVLRSTSEEVSTQSQVLPCYTPSPQSQSDEVNTDHMTRQSRKVQTPQDNAFIGTAGTFGSWSIRAQPVQDANIGRMQTSHNVDGGHPMIHNNEKFPVPARHEQMRVASRRNVQSQPHHRQQAMMPNAKHITSSTPMKVAPASVAASNLNLQHHTYDQNSNQLSPSGSSPSDLTAHVITAADQINASGGNLTQRIVPAQAMAMGRTNTHVAPPQRRSSTQVNTMQRSRSGPVSQEPSPVDSAQYVPTPPQFRFNTQFERNVPAQHVQASTSTSFTTPSLWQPRFPQHQVPVPTQPQSARPTFYNVNQNFYLGHSEVTQSQHNSVISTVPPNVYNNHPGLVNQNLPTANVIVQPQTQPTFVMSQQMHVAPRNLPHPPILGSNMNMFSGQARTSNAYGQRPEPPKKERANMFTSRNTATGTPISGGIIMGMEDVRRQIEMT